MPVARLLSVNLAELRDLRVLDGRTIRTGIFKEPVPGPVMARRDGLEGDAIGDPSVHGGEEKAVYAYSQSDVEWWEAELDRELPEGFFGQNLTLAGVDASGALVGERWRVGGALFEVAGPRLPCFKLAARVGDRGFERRFGKAARPGAYLRVLEEGELSPGDAVELEERPDHGVTVALVSRAVLGEKELRPKVLEAPCLQPSLRRHIERGL
jgi:MOSC domain-containing protein YiiM